MSAQLEVSYNSVINACAQTGYVERAEMWLGRMLEAGVQANEARAHRYGLGEASFGAERSASTWFF